MAYLLDRPMNGVSDAIHRYREILQLFENAPRCPDKQRGPLISDQWETYYCVKPVGGRHESPSVSELSCENS